MRAVPFELKFERIIAGCCINCGVACSLIENETHVTREAGHVRPASFSCKRDYTRIG